MRVLCAALTAFFVLALLPCSAGTLNPEEAASKNAGCGTQRVLVKQLDDASAPYVHFTPAATTVHYLRSLPVPSGYSKFHDERYDAESQVYAVQARLVEWKAEADHDFHIVIADPSNASETMVVEPPDPDCPAMKASGYGVKTGDVRALLIKCFGHPPSTHFVAFPPKTIGVLTGPAFFDTDHGEKGGAPNAIELHPLLRLQFSVPCGSYR